MDPCWFGCRRARQRHRSPPISLSLPLSSQSFKDFLANPPQAAEGDDDWKREKSEREKEDERILALLEGKIAGDAAAKEAARREAEVTGIAREWAIREYARRGQRGELDAAATSEQDFVVASWMEARAAAEETLERIASPEYRRAAARTERARNRGALFYPGMREAERTRRERIVARVKEQYVDMLSDAEMERIIASEI